MRPIASLHLYSTQQRQGEPQGSKDQNRRKCFHTRRVVLASDYRSWLRSRCSCVHAMRIAYKLLENGFSNMQLKGWKNINTSLDPVLSVLTGCKRTGCLQLRIPDRLHCVHLVKYYLLDQNVKEFDVFYLKCLRKSALLQRNRGMWLIIRVLETVESTSGMSSRLEKWRIIRIVTGTSKIEMATWTHKYHDL